LLRRTVSGIMLSLLVMSSLAFAFRIKTVKADPEGQLLLETDKQVYKLGENVTTTLTNIGDEIIPWMGYKPGPWDIFTFPGNRCVFDALECYCYYELDAGESVTYTWNQSDYYTVDPVEPGTYEVRDNQGWGLSAYFTMVNEVRIVPDDYSTIQEAVNNANVGDMIFVKNGTYYENVIVNKSLMLVGESKDTIISQNYSNVTLEITEDNVTVEGLTILNNFEVYENPPMPCCIFLNSSSNCQIRDNELDFNYPSYGLAIKGGSGNRIEKNTAQNGIFIYGGSENRIEENIVDDVGIYVYGSTLNVIIRNTVHSQYDVLELTSSNYNEILYNYLYPVSFTQICMSMYYSNNNTIEGNTMVSGWEGISRMELYLSCNNSIFHNNFNGDRGAEVLIDEDSEHNVWDNGYPSGGNYWSDYNGTDSDGDGIGDIPYIIDENNTDNYPLMNLFWYCWDPGDVDHDFDVDLYDAVELLAIYGSRVGDEEYNSHCDVAKPYGIINLYDAVLLLASYGEKYP
jgi:parallel beta-helix repeat protein